MSKMKILISIFIMLCFIAPAEAFNFCFWSKPSPEQLENPKLPKTEEEDLPDILIPEPETPKEAKKREKEELKELKHSSKKSDGKSSNFKKNKKLKKYTYRSIKGKNKAPKTFAEYLEMSKDIKREDMQIPRPSFPKDDKIVNLPDPGLRLVKYNNPPGGKELDLRQLMTRRQLTTPAVLSPDKTRLVYSVVYSYPTAGQVASEIFVINIPGGLSEISALRDMHTIEADRTPVLRTGTDRFAQYEKKTFTILDWSEDGQKLAVKEKIGALTQGPWKTQIWTYDFKEGKGCELTALREAIRYYWKNTHKLDLIDYMWDIYPIGWDMYNKDRIVVYAYAFGKNHTGIKFLGTWSIDYKNQRSELMSEIGTDFEVSINGYSLEFTHE